MFMLSDLSNFPSKVKIFSFQQRNFVNLHTLSYRTFLANKYYDLMIIHTLDNMTSLSYDGMEYINIRGINYYPDGNQTQANAYEMKIFWHEISVSAYRGARATFIETPIIKQSSATGNNISNVAEFRLVKADYQTWKLQWKVGTTNASYTQTWLGEIDVYGRIIHMLTFTGVTADYLGGTDKWIAYD